MAAINVIGVAVSIIMIALVSVLGLVVISTSGGIFYAMPNTPEAILAYNTTVNTIYAAWPLFGIAALAFLIMLILAAFNFR